MDWAIIRRNSARWVSLVLRGSIADAVFKQDYYNFHRIDMHSVLLDTAKAESSKEMGPQGKIVVNHKAVEVLSEKGIIKFENGDSATADLIIAADGIRVDTTPQRSIEFS